MATVIDELMIKLGLDGSGAKKGMKETENAVKGSMKNITSTIETGFSSVTKIFTGFGAALAGAFSVGSAFNTWKEQAAELGGVSRRLKMSMEDVQGWTGAIGKFGGSAQDFEGTLRGLNGQLARMATIGKSRTGTLLQSLGIDAGEVGRQRNALDVLQDLAGVIEQMSPDESRGILQAIGLDPATIMLLQQGREGMKDLVRQKKEDAVYTQEDADAIKEYNIAMAGVKKGFMGIMSVLFRSVTPAFTKVAKYVGDFVKSLKKHQTAVKAFFVMVGLLVMRWLIPAFMQFAKALLTNPLTWVILALAALAAVIEDLIVWLEGGDSALEKFWEELFGDREEAKKTFKEIKESAETFVKETIPQLKELGSEFKTLINIVGDFFKAISQSTPWKILQHHLAEARRENEKFRDQMQDDIDRQLGKTPDSEKFGGGGGGFEPDPIGETLREARRSLEEPLLETWENIKRGIDDTLRDIKTLWDDAVKWITDKWNNLKSTASSVCGTIKGAISDLASFIMSSIGGAIDWAIEKWNALKAMVSGGSAFVNHELTASYARAAIGGTTNTSATYNVGSVNFTGATNGRQAAADFSNYLTKQSNNGIRW
jgi:hypothetical protein